MFSTGERDSVVYQLLLDFSFSCMVLSVLLTNVLASWSPGDGAGAHSFREFHISSSKLQIYSIL